MSHFLFRPHISHPDKVVTIDFILRGCLLVSPQGAAVALPIDALSSAVSIQLAQGRAMLAPAICLVSGDATHYAAPAVCVVDGDLFDHDPNWAWRHARVAVSRQAVPINSLQQPPQAPGVAEGRKRATVMVTAAPSRLDQPKVEVRLELQEGRSISQDWTVLPIAEQSQ